VRIQSGGNGVLRRRRQGEIAVGGRGAPPVGSLTARRNKYRIRSKLRHCCPAKRAGQRIGAWRQSLMRQAVRKAWGPTRASAPTRRGRKISPAHMAQGAPPVRRLLGTKGVFVADSRCWLWIRIKPARPFGVAGPMQFGAAMGPERIRFGFQPWGQGWPLHGL
jgi:hypothetical protein